MSAANRGRERLQDDQYFTPTWCVDRLFEKIDLPGGLWVEPGAGRGQIIATVNTIRDDVRWTAVELQKAQRKELKKHLPSENIIIGDYLSVTRDSPGQGAGQILSYNVAIGNPPYSLAQEFIEASLKISLNVVFLLRINFLGSEDRAPWMKTHVPDLYVLPNRPSFKVFVSDVYFCSHCDYGKEKSVPEGNKEPRCQGCGKGMAYKGQKKSSSDASEYAWFHFRNGTRTEGKVVMLNSTPKALRKMQE